MILNEVKLKTGTESEDMRCQICFSKNSDSVIYPCGHGYLI